MIQRIQSIWLLLAAITISCLIFIPIVTTTANGAEYYLVASGIYQKSGSQKVLVEGTTPLLISTIAVAFMALANIFNFRKRTIQKRLIMANVVLILGLSFWCSLYAKKIPGGLEAAAFGIGTFLPMIAILFSILAMKGINNDEKLLKSADRLR